MLPPSASTHTGTHPPPPHTHTPHNHTPHARRRKSFYLPWKCEHERHAYEVCQYKEYKRRVALAKLQHEAEAAQ